MVTKLNLKQFLNAGDDVNARGADGSTALFWSVLRSHPACVKILLAAGADPSMCDNRQWFPLCAAAHANLAIVKALIRAHADVDAIIDDMAAFRGHKDIVKVLLDAGCDTSKTATAGRHPLTIAVLKEHPDVFTMLLDAGADANAVDPRDGMTALLAGAQIGSCDVVRSLLEAGANVNYSELRGESHYTWPRNGHDVVVDILIAAGAAVEQTDLKNRTPLHMSAFIGHPKCAYALLRAGANVSARDSDGSTALHLAARGGFTDVIEVLLSAGAQQDVNIEDEKHRFPLKLASAFADAKAVNLILDAGADVNQLDALGRTALCAASDIKIVKALLDRGANVKVIDNSGSSVLHFAGYFGKTAGVICALFKAGADPTVKGSTGHTAADDARSQGHEDTAKLLDLLAAKHRSIYGGEEGSASARAMMIKVISCVVLLAAVGVAFFFVRKDAVV